MTEQSAQALIAGANDLEAKAKGMREEASALLRKELAARPLLDRMVFAATTRCECGAGMAYDPIAEDAPFMRPSKWQCSDIIRFADLDTDAQVRTKAATHTAPLPFACYEVKSENQPSANGLTTRPKPDAE